MEELIKMLIYLSTKKLLKSMHGLFHNVHVSVNLLNAPGVCGALGSKGAVSQTSQAVCSVLWLLAFKVLFIGFALQNEPLAKR